MLEAQREDPCGWSVVDKGSCMGGEAREVSRGQNKLIIQVMEGNLILS